VVAGLGLLLRGDGDITVPQSYEGTWTGTVQESRGFGSSGVGATMTMREGQRTATLKYDTAACDGELTLTGQSAVELTFEVTRGQCPATTVRVYISDGVLTLDAPGPGYTASGRLERTGG
jgi:hypothetical protein